MKKYRAMLLIFAMLLPCILAAAGVMTDKVINSAVFAVGNIRKDVKRGSLDFRHGAYTSCCIADAIDNLPDYSHRNKNIASCFRLREEGQHSVVGHHAGAYLWFVYPTDNLADGTNANFRKILA